MKAVQCL